MRVIVTGSRNWPAADAIWQILDIVAAEWVADNERLYVRHGGCPEGADLAAHIWCESHPLTRPGVYVTEEICRAAWTMGRGAGYSRNRRMVDDVHPAQLCIAFIAPCVKPQCDKPLPHGSHGTTDCADYAEKRGVTTWRYTA